MLHSGSSKEARIELVFATPFRAMFGFTELAIDPPDEVTIANITQKEKQPERGDVQGPLRSGRRGSIQLAWCRGSAQVFEPFR